MNEAAKLALLKTEDGKGKMPVRSEKITPLKAVILYEVKEDKDLLDKVYLEEIQALEKDIVSMSEWNDLCWAKSTTDTSCNDNAMVSGLGFLKANGINDLKSATQDDIDKAFMTIIADDNLWKQYGMMFNLKEQILREGKVKYIRSFMEFGAPLNIDGQEFKDITDNFSEQKKIIT